MTTNPEVVDSVTVVLGCDPQIFVTIIEKTNGALFFEIDPVDPDAEMPDLDGFFFDLTDDALASDLNAYPGINTLGVTDFSGGANAQNTLANGATTNDAYDVKFQFGTVNDSTEGEINTADFVLFTNTGAKLSLDDIDFDSMAAVIDSDTGNGHVLTVNPDGVEDTGVDDGTGDDDGDTNAPDACTFLIEGQVNVQVSLTQLEDGEIQVSLSVPRGDDPDATGSIGDLRGLFFDIDDPDLLNGLTVSGDDVSDSRFADGSVDNLGNGANVKGVSDGPYDGGVEFGSSGIGKDDIQETIFTLSHPDGLSLEDFAGQDFAVRLTSVGTEGGGREGSLKLAGTCPESEPPVVDDCAAQYSLDDVMALFLDDPLSDEMPSEDDGQNDDVPEHVEIA